MSFAKYAASKRVRCRGPPVRRRRSGRSTCVVEDCSSMLMQNSMSRPAQQLTARIQRIQRMEDQPAIDFRRQLFGARHAAREILIEQHQLPRRRADFAAV